MTGTIGSLFSGILGLDLGLELCGLGPLLWCAEKDSYARGVIAHHRPEARLYSDVRRIDESAPRVDVICGGFPCQDISVAGKGAGLAGKRSGLWREFARVIRLLRPSLVFVENVAALRRRGLDVVLGDLAALGFDADWTTVRASDVGAPHIRERLFLLAHSDRRYVADAALVGRQGRDDGAAGASSGTDVDGRGDVDGPRDVADADGGAGRGLAEPAGQQGPRGGLAGGRGAGGGHGHGFPPGPAAIAGWPGPQPAVRRSAHGLRGRVDRLRCLGNAVVPLQAALAFRILISQALAEAPVDRTAAPALEEVARG